MKNTLTVAVLGIVLLSSGASTEANPPTPVAQVPGAPVPPPMQRDGPYRVLVAAKVDARHRRAQGFRADVVIENGLWWVLYYP